MNRFWSKVGIAAADECWGWTASMFPTGYGKFRGNNGTTNYSHRVAWELSFGGIKRGLCVCHRCDNRACCNPRHLFLGTKKDNARDCVMKGRTKKYAKKSVKLSPPLVLAMRDMRDEGHTFRRIADQFGVTSGTVSRVVNRQSWVDV